jgi:cell division septation protein DedD
MDFIRFFIILLILSFLLAGCSAGEYDLDKYTFENTEKIVEADTISPEVKNETKEEIREEISNPPESYTYIVQVGAFFIESNFTAFFDYSKRILGSEVYYAFINSLYKIRIGSFTDKEEALKYLYHVRDLGFSDAFVITVKK